MDQAIDIRQMKHEDIDLVYDVFTKYNIRKPKEYVLKCWNENQSRKRISLLAFYNGELAGSLHLLKKSFYPAFIEEKIPEINDFNVIEPLKRKGIGSALMDAAEQIAFDQYGKVGLGVGMHIYYGPAQRLYAKRGYIPDGRGLMYHNEPVMPGAEVCADDDLILYLVKKSES